MKDSMKQFLPLILLTGWVMCMLPASAQSPDLEKPITVVAQDTTLQYVLDEISRQGNFTFSYLNNKFDLGQKVSINAQHQPIRAILEEVCRQANLEFVPVEKQVILKPKKRTATEDPSKSKSTKHTISGYVKDKSSGELLLYANIKVKELNAGTSSNAYGFYSLTLPEGDYTLEYSYIGYQPWELPVNLTASQTLDAEMQMDEKQLETVEVTAEENNNFLEKSQTSQIKLKTHTIREMPGLMGESELIKSMHYMPGIQNHGDGSVYFYVRGGNKDQNLMLIDDAPIYNPSHLLGFFSSFTPDVIKDVEIYKGDMPARLGGGLASVIDIRTKDGNMKHHIFSGNIGIIASKFSLEGPLKKDRASYLLSYRRSQLGLILPRTITSQYRLFFRDLNAKFNYKFDERNRFYFTLYNGYDFYGRVPTGFSSFGISWTNSSGTIRWNHLYNDKLFSNIILNTSRYDYFLYLNEQQSQFWQESITNASFQNNFTYYFDPTNTLQFGIQIKGHEFNPGNLEVNELPTGAVLPWVPTSRARHTVLYISDEHHASKWLSIQAGLRLNNWVNMGPSEYYKFDSLYQPIDTVTIESKAGYHDYANLEPRISLKYTVDSVSSIKSSFSRTTQFIQLLSNSVSPFTTLDVWLPAGPNIKPQIANQLVFGYYRKLRHHHLTLSAELYYKEMFNQIEYKDHAHMLLNPLIEGELRFGKAWAYGLELQLQKQRGRLRGWVAYTLSTSRKQIQDVNNGQPFRAYQDRPHDFSINLSYKASDRWELSGGWVCATGAAITTPTSFYEFQGKQVPIYASKNNDRLPTYHRMDLSATRRLHKDPNSRYQHYFTFGLYNAYGRRNPIGVSFNKYEVGERNFKVPTNVIEDLPLAPSSINLLGVIPSINYKFRY